MNSESQLQAKCFQWAWNELPETRRLLCYNLGNSTNRIQGAQNKALGLIKGRADMELLWRGRLYYFEFKYGRGRQAEAQKQFEDAVKTHGAEYYIVTDLEQFKLIVWTILS